MDQRSAQETEDAFPAAFEQWLKADCNRVPAKLFHARLRQRIATENDALLNDRVDALLRSQPVSARADFTPRLQARLNQRTVATRVTSIFDWLRPLAAAAVLGLVFYSFQSQAPQPNAEVATSSTATLADDPYSADIELTRIFALASALPLETDFARLQTEESIAFLLR